MEQELYHYGVLGMKWGVRRYRNTDGTLTSTGKKRYSKTDATHEDYRKAHDNKSVKEMSDAELRNRNNRLQMERQYKQLTKKTSKGKKVVNTFIATAGSIVAVETAYKTYKRVGNAAIDKIGDVIMSDLNKGLSRGF